MFNRKVKKLIRDPKLFFSDMLTKQKKKIKNTQPKEYNGAHQYTVVSAVYNVGRYLDEYFNSIIKQRLDFKNHIHLILVDDGSTDDSAEIIKRWEKKYPNNITYLYKKNGGQASARNLGIASVNTEWVTFMDPDDFVDRDYFHSIDVFLKKNKKNDASIISCNLVSYFDDLKLFKDVHPLKYRYQSGDSIFPVNNLGKQLQLSAATAFFKISVIRENSILFDSRLKPSFEDAHFVSNYFMYIQDGYAGFLKSAKYFYRKRSDGSSTLDNAWKHPGLYDSVLEYGCLDILRKYDSLGVEIPKFIKFTILYHLIWFIKAIVNNPQKIFFLDDNQKTRFTFLIREIFTYIDVKTVLEFGLAGCWFYHKVGMLACFKQTDPNFQIVYIESYDPIKKLIELKYFSRKDELLLITENNKEVFPYYSKTVSHNFIEEDFVKEKRIWVPISENVKFNVQISKTPTLLTLTGKQYKDGLNTNTIVSNIKQQIPKYEKSEQYCDVWLFMDRDVQADDNAEHLYEYVQKNHPQKNIYFALTKTSHDWNRLKNKSFNLVEYGSEKHEEILKSCSKLISSHADKYVTNYLGAKMLAGRHFVFLQHGVIHNDLSDWLNQKDNIDLFITTSPAEYEAISGENTPYKFTKKNVKLTGLPRYDKFYNIPKNDKKILLIMPTWRANAVGKANGNGYLRDYIHDFMETKYAQHWYSLLHSETMKKLAEANNFKIVFFPHVNIAPYIKSFSVPNYIEVYQHTDISIQDLFINSTMMITDYSSVAFDMAALGKQTLYYQFDREDFFSGGHTLKKGYFDHYRNGFGPVVENEKELLEKLQYLLENNGIPDPLIQQRIDETFPVIDGRNCERAYMAICELDKPVSSECLNTDLIENFAIKATEEKNWTLAISRWNVCLDLDNAALKERAKINLIEALREDGKINLALDNLNSIDIYDNDNEIKIEKAKILMYCHKWQDALDLWEQLTISEDLDKLYYLICLVESGNLQDYEIKTNLLTENFSDAFNTITKSYRFIFDHAWQNAIDLLTAEICTFTQDELNILKPALILARCYRENGETSESQLRIKEYKLNSNNTQDYRFEEIALAFNAEKWSLVESHFNDLNIFLKYLSPKLSLIYLVSLRKSGKSSLALKMFEELPFSILELSDFKVELGENYLATKQWDLAANIWLDLIHVCEFSRYRLAKAYRMLGMIEEGLEIITSPGVRGPMEISEWILRAELAHLAANWEEAVISWSSILRFYPNNAPTVSWDRLNNARLMLAITKTNTDSSIII